MHIDRRQMRDRLHRERLDAASTRLSWNLNIDQVRFFFTKEALTKCIVQERKDCRVERNRESSKNGKEKSWNDFAEMSMGVNAKEGGLRLIDDVLLKYSFFYYEEV